MKERIAAGLVILILSVTTVQYCQLIVLGDIKPVLASWLLYTTASSLNWLTYWSSPKRSILANIGVVSGCISTWVILGTIVVSSFFLGRDIRLGFTQFEIICFLICGCVIVWWHFTKNYEISNYAFQVITSIGYFPLYIHLLSVTENTEPFSLWFAQLAVTGFSLIPAISGKDKLAIINSSRGFLLVACLLVLIARLEFFTHS